MKVKGVLAGVMVAGVSVFSTTSFAKWYYATESISHAWVTLSDNTQGQIPNGTVDFTYTDDSYEKLHKGLKKISIEAAYDETKLYTGNFVTITLVGEGDTFKSASSELWLQYLAKENISASRSADKTSVSFKFCAYSLYKLDSTKYKYYTGMQKFLMKQFLNEAAQAFNLHPSLVQAVGWTLTLPEEGILSKFSADRILLNYREVSGREDVFYNEIVERIVPDFIDYYQFGRYDT